MFSAKPFIKIIMLPRALDNKGLKTPFFYIAKKKKVASIYFLSYGERKSQ